MAAKKAPAGDSEPYSVLQLPSVWLTVTLVLRNYRYNTSCQTCPRMRTAQN
nr:MAG TPA: hypothetical protein [Caudoviricetes sp.]